MPAPVLVIGHGNGHNKASLVRFAREADCDSFGGNETQRLIGDLEKIPGHRVTVAGDDYREAKDPSGSTNRHRSTSILTRSTRTNVGELVRQVSERVDGVEKWAPDRMLVGSFYEHPLATWLGYEGVAHFELHPDATVRNRDESHPIVKAYRESLTSARKWMTTARHDGLLVILTGDLQVPGDFERPFGPGHLIAEPLALRHRAVGIDWILFDKALALAAPLYVRELHDHRGFVATLEAAKGPKR